MKKFFSVLFGLLFIVIICDSVFDLGNVLFDFDQKKAIKEDKPTELQIGIFENKLDDRTFYYYNHLDEQGKEAYLTLYQGFIDYNESITVPESDYEIGDLFISVLYDNPDIFWVDIKYEYIINSDSIEFSPKFRLSEEDVESMNKKMDRKIDEIMSVVDSLDTEYDKELYIHNYITQNTEYVESTIDKLGDTAYSVLVDGYSICEGYARATQILLDEAGISNYLVIGEAEYEGVLEPHMWNIVTIDGKNYHLDVTWNDLDDDLGTSYFYFNVNDNFISSDHINIKPSHNNCYSSDANYFVVDGSEIGSFNGFNSHIERSVKKLNSGSNSISFYFKNREDYDKAVNDLNDNDVFFDYVNKTVKKCKRKILSDSVDYFLIEEHCYLCLVFKEG